MRPPEATDPDVPRPSNIDHIVIACFFALFSLLGMLLLVLRYGVSAAAGGLLWALACFSLGSMVGFLFGIPRILQQAPARARRSASRARPAQRLSSYRLGINTNLEQISDWLTKIFVGVGLVELQTLPDRLMSAAAFIARGLGDTEADRTVACALILYFVIGGFAAGYMLTRLYLQGAFARADQMSQQPLREFERKVERAVRTVLATGQGTAEVPTERQLSVAEQIGELSLGTDQTIIREQVLSLAREYERIRSVMKAGAERTRRMEYIVTKMRTLALAGYFLLPELKASSSPGARLAAIALLELRPAADSLDWLAERFSAERSFVAYHAAVALRAAVRALGPENAPQLERALEQARQAAAAGKPDPLRDDMLAAASAELAARRPAELVVAAAGPRG